MDDVEIIEPDRSDLLFQQAATAVAGSKWTEDNEDEAEGGKEVLDGGFRARNSGSLLVLRLNRAQTTLRSP